VKKRLESKLVDPELPCHLRHAAAAMAHCHSGRFRAEHGRAAEATPRRARHTTLFPLPLIDATRASQNRWRAHRRDATPRHGRP